MIDLRSDTVTLPTDAMRRAMFEADVGDDVMGEDPTINRLEALAARTTGKEAALFVCSGTMGNQLALMVHVQRGQEVILEASSHILCNEAGGAAYLSGAQMHPIPGECGCMPLQAIEAAIQTPDIHHPVTGLICVENTHNAHGGVALPLSYLRDLRGIAWVHRLPIHMDGARLFNAALAVGETPSAICACVDTVTFCLSKGLGAPAGSMLCGSHAFIDRARRLRKMIGGGMRQVGVLAAAGLVAMREGVARLGEDHITAKRLALGLRDIPGISIDLHGGMTNIVYFDLLHMHAARFVEEMAARGVLLFDMGDARVRMVTHRHIDAADIDDVLAKVAEVLGATRSLVAR